MERETVPSACLRSKQTISFQKKKKTWMKMLLFAVLGFQFGMHCIVSESNQIVCTCTLRLEKWVHG
jgi:hypothetical protein